MDDDDPPNVVTSISRHELTAVAQRDLLHWLNQTLQTDYGQITDVNDGIAYLQILDAIWPGASGAPAQAQLPPEDKRRPRA